MFSLKYYTQNLVGKLLPGRKVVDKLDPFIKKIKTEHTSRSSVSNTTQLAFTACSRPSLLKYIKTDLLTTYFNLL